MSPAQSEPKGTFTPFWPLVLLAASLATVLLWNLVLASREYYQALRLRDRQVEAAAQAIATEQKLKALMMELLAMSEADRDAQAIVEKYQVRYNAAAPGAPRPAAGPLND